MEEQTNEKWHQKIEELQAEVTVLNKHLQQLRQSQIHAISQASEMKGEAALAYQHVNLLTKQKDALALQLQTQKSVCQEMAREVQLLREKIGQQERKMVQLQAINEGTKRQISILQNSKKPYRKQSKKHSIKEFISKLIPSDETEQTCESFDLPTIGRFEVANEMQKSIPPMQVQRVDRKQLLDMLQKALQNKDQEINAQRRKLKLVMDQCEQHVSKISQLQIKLDYTLRLVQDHQKSINSQRAQISHLQQHRQDSQHAILSLTQTNCSQELQLVQLKNLLSEESTYNSDRGKDYSQLKRQVMAEQACNQEYKVQLEIMRKRLKTRPVRSTIIQEKRIDCSSMNPKLLSELQTLYLQNFNLQARLQAQEDARQQLESQLCRLEHQNSIRHHQWISLSTLLQEKIGKWQYQKVLSSKCAEITTRLESQRLQLQETQRLLTMRERELSYARQMLQTISLQFQRVQARLMNLLQGKVQIPFLKQKRMCLVSLIELVIQLWQRAESDHKSFLGSGELQNFSQELQMVECRLQLVQKEKEQLRTSINALEKQRSQLQLGCELQEHRLLFVEGEVDRLEKENWHLKGLIRMKQEMKEQLQWREYLEVQTSQEMVDQLARLVTEKFILQASLFI